MKRRSFIHRLGLGATPLILPSSICLKEGSGTGPVYRFQQAKTLQEAISKDGHIILRIEFRSDKTGKSLLQTKLEIESGHIFRSKNYFFKKEAVLSATGNNETDILVLWLDKYSERTKISLSADKQVFSFTLAEIIENLERKGKIAHLQLTANFLLDHEIGEIHPSEVNIRDIGEDFSFIIMADPQGGDVSNPDDNRCRMKIHNAFVEESVKLANHIKAKPAFCMMLGDIVDHQGEARDFAQMAKFFEKLKMPVLYEMGNHESRYRTSFSPGYNLSGFNNYFAAQKAMNGMELLLYSFNLGKWHFIVWPDPLREEFWENHPHYFDWLEQDLEKYSDRPTVFFQHVPMQPVGINPLVNYVESVTVKRLIFEILSKHENVKTIFSGHVHIPIKSSFKTAVSIKGINCINLPAAGYRPRAFGEGEYYGRPSQGICIVDIKGHELIATYKAVTKEEFIYPQELPEFEHEKYPLWLNHKWELPAGKQIVNGDFSKELEGWGQRFVYREDDDVSNICEVRNSDTPALYLKTRKRAFHVPGQDRLPQDINRVFQVVELDPKKSPFLEFEYKLDGRNSDFNAYNGLYIWLEGFRGSGKVSNQLYFANRAWSKLGSTYGSRDKLQPVIYALDRTTDQWQQTIINIKADFDRNKNGLKFQSQQADKLCIHVGIWNINDGREGQSFAAFLKNFRITYDIDIPSHVNGKKIELAKESDIWYRGKTVPWDNIAGEHHYHLEGLKDLKY